MEPGIQTQLEAEYDITQEILVVKDKGINLSTDWAKAHQDNNVAIELLPLDAHLNIQADTNATSFCLNMPVNLSPRSQPTLIPANQAQITIDDVFITSQLHKWIHNIYNSSDISLYIMHRMGLTCQLMQAIN
eukprot:14534375-Ditylum_brightwellii.AAC.1